jgi:hypothetical protein
MYLKIMSGENCADSDSRKTFRLLDDVIAVRFDRNDNQPDRPSVTITFGKGPGETYWPEGNCYLMNDNGKTIASFGVAPPHTHVLVDEGTPRIRDNDVLGPDELSVERAA